MKKIVLITGASSGVGAEAGRQFADKGYRVVLVARDEPRLSVVASTIGASATYYSCDASIGSAVENMARHVIDCVGVPDVVIHSAGLGEWKRIEDTSLEEAREMIGAPYLAAFNVTRAFMPAMLERQSGVFIHVNSPACFMPWPSSVGYTASRFALRGLHEALYQDLVGTGVKSCHVVFGRIHSEYFQYNPSAAKRMPGIANTIRTLSVQECANVLMKVAEKPRRQLVHPWMLKMYHWSNAVFPPLTRWLLRVTAPRQDVSSEVPEKV